MSRYTEYGYDEKWGKVQVNYGTDRALGYWYDVMRVAPDLEVDVTIQGIDVETEVGYIHATGTMRSIKTFDGEHWFEKGEKALFELDQPYDFCFEPDCVDNVPALFPASNHIWLGQYDIYEDNPLVDRCTTFNNLTKDQWATELQSYGVNVNI